MLLTLLIVPVFVNNVYTLSTGLPITSTTWTSSVTTSVPTTTPEPETSGRQVICKNFRNLEEISVEHGDMSCSTIDTPSPDLVEKKYEEEELLVRATLLNLDLLRKYYHKKIPYDMYITKVNVLNFGQSQAFVDKVIIENGDGAVDGQVWAYIEVPPMEAVKLFVEIYGHKKPY